MVTKKIINNILTKCLTHAQIRNKLSDLSRHERVYLLDENNKLTRAEWIDYNEIFGKINQKIVEIELDMEDAIEEYREDYYEDEEEYPSKIPKSLTKPYLDEIEKYEKELDDALFYYDKRIYTNYKISDGNNPIPKVNWDDYEYDMDGIESLDIIGDEGAVDLFYTKLHASRDSIGVIENKYITNQENINYTKKELNWLQEYFTDNQLPSFLTYKINGREPKKYITTDIINDEYIEYNLTDKWKQDFNNIKHHLDNAIDKSKGLDKPTIFYHAGRIDPTLLPGDHGIWKGYKSMSFQEQVMQKHKNINEGYWNIIVLAPTGTKGVCANDERFKGYSFVDEHEYLLGRNTGYTVVDIDYDTGTEIVMLDG